MMREIHDNAGAGASGAMEESEVGENGGAEVDMDDCGSLALPPDLPPYSGDYIICDYMERLGTRLNILETELKYAWRALDLLSQEYVRMWERLERLETLLADQQGVISTLLDFYTCRTVTSRDPISRLEVIREILGNGTVEDGIEEGLDIGRSSVLLVPQDEVMESNEAFYKSLNQAYRDDLVCDETSRPQSQLDMIWEAPEEPDIEIMPTSSRQIYSSTDYKHYCGLKGGPDISERDLVDLSALSAIDQITVDKLHELDRLTNQLHKDSRELKDLKTRLLSPETKITKHDREIEAKALVEDGNIINEQLKGVYSGGDHWAINDMMKSFDDFMLTAPKDAIVREKSPSRLSLTDTVTDRTIDYLPPTLSPRRKFVPERTTTEPYTTVTGRLAYSSAVANAEINAAKASKSPSALSRERFEYSATYQVTDTSRQIYFSSKGLSQPLNEIYKSGSEQHSPLSIHEIYNGPSANELTYDDNRLRKSPSPPPPAPPNGTDVFPSIENNNELVAHQPMLSTSSAMPHDGMRLSPRSPKSPKTSPKHVKRDSANIVAAKSDSGLSSMSGWSSLEKSPGSPKTGRIIHGSHDSHKMRVPSPQSIQRLSYELESKPYIETLVDSYLYEDKNLKSDYNLRKSEHMTKEISSRDLSKLQGKIDSEYLKGDISYSAADQTTQISNMGEYYYGNDAPSIYSVAGNRQPIFTTVYSTPRGILSEDRSFSELLDRNEIAESGVRPAVDSYPPEPSYHAQTVVMSAANANKRPLTRANTMGANDPHFYQNGYKGHRAGYPPGNLTDALSYYPTSSRYDSPKRASLEDQISWQGGSRSPTSSMETSSLKSHSLSITERKQFQNQLQQEYFKQQQYDQRNGNIMYENQGFDKQTPEHTKMRKEQYVESSGILVSESGYLSISNNLKGKQQEKQPKKPKRTSSLKSAMSSMSHWLPDLHLPKKHRSHSLPSGVDTVEQPPQEKSLKERILSAQRRKKKYHLVASMSGLLQKARRKQQASHQSLSDPETSETEWSGGRSSAQSEDSDSVFSDSTHEGNMFPKVATKPKRKMNNQEIVEQQQMLQERMQEQGLEFRDDDTECIIEENEKFATSSALPRDKSDDIDFHFARVSQLKKETNNIPKLEKLDIDTDISNVDLFEEEEKEDNQSPGSLFATIGDVKKSNVSDEGLSESNKSYSGSSQEFAVSRALGKYRLRKSTSVSDEHIADISPPKGETEPQEEISDDFQTQKEKKIRKLSTPEIVNTVTLTEETTTLPERSPSIQSTRGLPNKFQPRHQQSLEIPNKHDDDDSRSTHSWRSGSRVSSRRQSTEDSIDSEDEWYCYELRKLEEMEHQSQLEAERQQTLPEEPEFEDMDEEPNENLKEKMSFVLRELKLKTATVKQKYDESPIKDTWKDITTFPVIEETVDDIQERESDEDKSFDDSGSGETSGPDSPVQSGDELDDDYDMPEIHQEPVAVEEPPPQQDAPVGSKWKLLKALKDRKAEDKATETPAATTPSTEKDKVSAGVSYLMQKFHEIRVKS